MSQFPELKKQLRLLTAIAVILLVVQIINSLTGNGLNHLGVLPRESHFLGNIFLAPWLHGSPAHLLTNLVPLLLFIWLTLQWGNKRFIYITLAICVIGGFGVWLFGRTAIHIGASGMVYGYFGFLLLGGFRSGKIPLMIISVLVAVLYGGMLIGVLPSQAFVSFEYHLFGFIGGLIAAWAWGR